MSDERRRYPRGSADLEAVQRIGNRRIRRRVTGPSAGGLFVEGRDIATQVGELVVLEFEPPPPGQLFKVTAEVVRLTEHGAALRVTRADWTRLADLVR